ncbi:hypothetical protein JL720_2996 [Aureococcus anophagefferens]|nr:hypothetical protein JL720_2996 [Aureococcus anophagefferens]
MPANGRPAFRPSGESRQHTAAAGAAGETFARLPARRDGRNSVWNLAPGDVGQADADARTFLHLARPKPAPRAPRTLAQAKLDRAIADQIAEAPRRRRREPRRVVLRARARDVRRRRGAASVGLVSGAADGGAPRRLVFVPLGKRPTGDTKWLVVGGGRREPPSILVGVERVYAASFADRMLKVGACPCRRPAPPPSRPGLWTTRRTTAATRPPRGPRATRRGVFETRSTTATTTAPARAEAADEPPPPPEEAEEEEPGPRVRRPDDQPITPCMLGNFPMPDDDADACADGAAPPDDDDDDEERPRAPLDVPVLEDVGEHASLSPRRLSETPARAVAFADGGASSLRALTELADAPLPAATTTTAPSRRRRRCSPSRTGRAPSESQLALVASRRASGYPAGDDDPVARTSQLLVVGVDGRAGVRGAPRVAVLHEAAPGGAETLCCVLKYSKALERATGVVDNDAIVTVDTEAGALEIIYVTSRRDVVGLSSAPLPDDVEDEPRAPAPGGAQRLDRKVRVAAPNFGYWSTSDGLCAVWLDSLRGPATERTVSTKAGPTTTTTLARYGRGSETGFEPLPASLQEIRDGKVRRPPTQILAGWRHPDHEDHPCECLAYSPRGELFGGGTSLWAIHDDGSRATALDLPVAAVAVAWGGLL